MNQQIMYQVSTLQALMLGYTKRVITVEELCTHGNIGLGTFEDVNGEMILLDGHCYRAMDDGSVVEADPTMGVPFSSVTMMNEGVTFSVGSVEGIDDLKDILNNKIEEDFGLNSMHVVRIDASFSKLYARSEAPYRSQHVSLKDVLSQTQKDFLFEKAEGTLVCVYYPDYMDGINAPGWHLHFVSKDRTQGGHVFELKMEKGEATLVKINRIDIQLPQDPSFDTYSLKEASEDEIKKVEQGKE